MGLIPADKTLVPGWQVATCRKTSARFSDLYLQGETKHWKCFFLLSKFNFLISWLEVKTLDGARVLLEVRLLCFSTMWWSNSFFWLALKWQWFSKHSKYFLLWIVVLCLKRETNTYKGWKIKLLLIFSTKNMLALGVWGSKSHKNVLTYVYEWFPSNPFLKMVFWEIKRFIWFLKHMNLLISRAWQFEFW